MIKLFQKFAQVEGAKPSSRSAEREISYTAFSFDNFSLAPPSCKRKVGNEFCFLSRRALWRKFSPAFFNRRTALLVGTGVLDGPRRKELYVLINQRVILSETCKQVEPKFWGGSPDPTQNHKGGDPSGISKRRPIGCRGESNFSLGSITKSV